MAQTVSVGFRLEPEEKRKLEAYLKRRGVGLRELVTQLLEESQPGAPGTPAQVPARTRESAKPQLQAIERIEPVRSSDRAHTIELPHPKAQELAQAQGQAAKVKAAPKPVIEFEPEAYNLLTGLYDQARRIWPEDYDNMGKLGEWIADSIYTFYFLFQGLGVRVPEIPSLAAVSGIPMLRTIAWPSLLMRLAGVQNDQSPRNSSEALA